MTKKHFIMVADVIVKIILYGYVKKKHTGNIIRVFKHMLKGTNTNFDAGLFEEYIIGRIK